MAYAQPVQWTRGDAVTAAKMQKYSDSLNAINALAAYTGGSVAVFAPGVSGTIFTYQHAQRWLHYNGSGQIIDVNNDDNVVSLSDPADADWAVYDLDSIAWLYYGGYFRVEGVDWVAEDWEP